MSQLMKAATSNRRTFIKLGFTVILLGYLAAWLPHEAAGLSFIGLELGEWVKFLPQVMSGEVAADRNLFYLPPITLGLMLALWTAGWPNSRWQTWATRGLAVLVAMLAFPAIEAILEESPDQWLLRLVMILLVTTVALLVAFMPRRSRRQGQAIKWGIMLVLALVGLTLPTWAYLAVRPAVTQVLVQEVGVGPGIWLNAIGHILVAAVALMLLLERTNTLRPNQAG
jgi:hypothetical protein